MNYTITNEWQSLSTIMGTDYDADAQYRVHNNVEKPAKLCITEVENPTNDITGKIYPEYCDIYLDKSLNSTTKIRHTFGAGSYVYDVEITKVEEEGEE